jgi:hypothetical protein
MRTVCGSKPVSDCERSRCVEAGTRRAGFAAVDLSDVFATVAEAFAPAAEDTGQILKASIAPDLRITGDREIDLHRDQTEDVISRHKQIVGSPALIASAVSSS